MKLALGMMVHNETAWLGLHLPVFAPCFNGVVIVTDDSTDMARKNAQLLQDGHLGWNMFHHEFEGHWGSYFNLVIDHAESLGYDAIVRLDADECIFPRDVEAIRQLLTTCKILCLVRWNFWGDRLHYTPGIFPDYQARAFVLNQGIRLEGQHHEGINWPKLGLVEGHPIADTPRDVLKVPGIQIYHYGDVGKQRMLDRDLHYLNVAREKEGLPPLTERPADRPFPTRHSISFHGPQPINPNVCGLYAPYTE